MELDCGQSLSEKAMLDGFTILMAEDDPGHASLIRRHIRRAGIDNEIVHFEDGQAVIDFLRNLDFSQESLQSYLLLLDIRMPKLDGLEVLEEIRQHQQLKSIPVVMLTTTRDPETINRCYELGCANYIVKPTSVSKFARVITELSKTLQAIHS